MTSNVLFGFHCIQKKATSECEFTHPRGMTTQEPEEEEGEGGEEEGRGRKRWHHLPKLEVASARVCVMPDTVQDHVALCHPSRSP